MGNLLEKIYDVVTDQAGFKGRVKLAEITGISKTRAVEMEDSAELISKFKAAADEIVGKDIDAYLKK